MDASILVVLLVVAFAALLLGGRQAIARGLNASAANGAALLVLATLVGMAALLVLADA